MAAPILLLLLLVASGGAFVGGDDGAALPHLELRGIEGSGGGHASDAPSQGLMDYLKVTHGCGSFAALLATTTKAGEIFQEHGVAGTGGGLTVFCPDDLAMAAFLPKFSRLSADDQTTILLHHVAAARYERDQLAAFEWAAVRTLAADAATNKTLFLTVRDDADTVWLWPSPPSRGSRGRATARVTKGAVSSEDSILAVYIVDGVLLPCRLRQLLGGGDEAAACSPCGAGGYLWWLHCTIQVWQGICLAVSGMAGVLSGVLIDEYYCSRRKMI